MRGLKQLLLDKMNLVAGQLKVRIRHHEVKNVRINGVNVAGRDIVINGDNVFADGVVCLTTSDEIIKIEIEGNVDSIETTSGDVTCGDVGKLSTMSGDVHCRDVLGSVKTMSGDVEANTIQGDVETMSGDISGVK